MGSKPILVDLFCGAGGCTKGYQRAGFYVIGVDSNPQPNYIGDEFYQMDAFEFLHWYSGDVSAYSASPPCQAHSDLKSLYKATDYSERHPDLVPATRAALRATGKPYVIENVEGAPLESPLLLCGSMFGLRVYRHRLFELSWYMMGIPHVPHRDNTPAVGRGVSDKGYISVTGTGGFGIPDGWNYACNAMGIDWMKRAELSQAIPPAYTEYIGAYLLEAIGARVPA